MRSGYSGGRAGLEWRQRLLPVGKAALAAIWAAAVLAGCRPAPPLTPEQAEGKHLYDVGCAHCHEENDLRLKKAPPSLHGIFDSKTLPDGAPATDAEVERVLLSGKGTMPSFAYQMSRRQMDAVIAYLHTGLRDLHR